MVKVALMGLGTVGGGVAELLIQHQEDIARRAGEGIEVAAALVRDPAKVRSLNGATPRLTTDPEEILGDKSISIVVEAMGGEEPALSLLKKALRRGKHVVTANKEVVSAHGQELFEAALIHRCHVLFEGSVGGGIPIISPLKHCLAANEINEVSAVINGTTNFILTEMTARGQDFAEVLGEAQARGYAEADPSADVDGLDAARKLAILASIAFNTRVTPAQVSTAGIRSIRAADTRYATELGRVIKLVATARRENGTVRVAVAPVMLPKDHPLAAVNGPDNAVLVRGQPVGRVVFSGPGAGRGATASAVVGDIMEIVRLRNRPDKSQCTCFTSRPVVAGDGRPAPFYARVRLPDGHGALERLTAAFAARGVALASVTRKSADTSGYEFVLVTRPADEDAVRAAIADGAADIGGSVALNVFRMEDGEMGASR
ncbi:MAG: homoserine dehydrogenase [Bacillota bacterium]